MMTYYVGVIDGADGAWGVRIPDLPGCHSAGVSHDEAITDATDAAREWAAHQVARSGTIPPARSLDAVLADAATEFDARIEVAVMIPLLLDRP